MHCVASSSHFSGKGSIIILLLSAMRGLHCFCVSRIQQTPMLINIINHDAFSPARHGATARSLGRCSCAPDAPRDATSAAHRYRSWTFCLLMASSALFGIIMLRRRFLLDAFRALRVLLLPPPLLMIEAVPPDEDDGPFINRSALSSLLMERVEIRTFNPFFCALVRSLGSIITDAFFFFVLTLLRFFLASTDADTADDEFLDLQGTVIFHFHGRHELSAHRTPCSLLVRFHWQHGA